MISRRAVVFIVIASLVLVLAEPAMAGPGGQIARAVFETFWGKVALAILAIILLPFIILGMVMQKRAENRARRDLRFMAAYSPQFDWLHIQQRAKDCFYRIHSSWENEDISDVSEWMTDWYWQNQQLAFLDRWKKEGLRNVCHVRKLLKIKPVLFVHRNQGMEHEDSMLVIMITARMKDYLEKRDSGAVVEGSRKYKDVERLWTFTLVDGQWKVSDIEEGSLFGAYYDMIRELPDIESTVVSDLRA